MQASSTRNCRSSTFLSNRDNNDISSKSISTANIRQKCYSDLLSTVLTPDFGGIHEKYHVQVTGKVRPPTSSPPPAGWAAPLCLDQLPPLANAADPTLPPSPVHTVIHRVINTQSELTVECTTNIRSQQWSHTKLQSPTFRQCFSPIDNVIFILNLLHYIAFIFVTMLISAQPWFENLIVAKTDVFHFSTFNTIKCRLFFFKT